MFPEQLSVVFAHKEIFYRIKQLLSYNFVFKKPDKQCGFLFREVNLFFLVVLFSSLFFVISLRFFPTDVDDIAVYHSLPELYAFAHQLVAFHNSITASTSGMGMTLQASLIILVGSRFVYILSFLFLLGFLFVIFNFLLFGGGWYFFLWALFKSS